MPGNDGAIIIIGTGAVGLGICGDEVIQVGGWGFPHDDTGSGAWLGLRAVEHTLRWLDGRFESDSQLLQDIYKKFDNNLSELVIWSCAAKSTQFATIAPIVIKNYKQNDALAITLMHETAKEINLIGSTLKTLPIALLGGLAEFIEPLLENDLRSRLVQPKFNAAKGAIFALMRHTCQH